MRYYGTIGYAVTEETSPGIWEEQIVERKYKGDVLRLAKRYEPTEYLNDDINVDNRLSIIADAFAYSNFQNLRYVSWMGTRWIVKSVEVSRPRLILTIGGVYNGPEPDTTASP